MMRGVGAETSGWRQKIFSSFAFCWRGVGCYCLWPFLSHRKNYVDPVTHAILLFVQFYLPSCFRWDMMKSRGLNKPGIVLTSDVTSLNISLHHFHSFLLPSVIIRERFKSETRTYSERRKKNIPGCLMKPVPLTGERRSSYISSHFLFPSRTFLGFTSSTPTQRDTKTGGR